MLLLAYNLLLVFFFQAFTKAKRQKGGLTYTAHALVLDRACCLFTAVGDADPSTAEGVSVALFPH